MARRLIPNIGRAAIQEMAITINEVAKAIRKATRPVPRLMSSPRNGTTEPMTDSTLKTMFSPRSIITKPTTRRIQS